MWHQRGGNLSLAPVPAVTVGAGRLPGLEVWYSDRIHSMLGIYRIFCARGRSSPVPGRNPSPATSRARRRRVGFIYWAWMGSSLPGKAHSGPNIQHIGSFIV